LISLIELSALNRVSYWANSTRRRRRSVWQRQWAWFQRPESLALTLGGGWGHLSGKYGLALDNLIGVDVVTADGRFVTANASENEDLFWGVRGGGGNFGVVTSLQYR
jgi:hypothetical protein